MGIDDAAIDMVRVGGSKVKIRPRISFLYIQVGLEVTIDVKCKLYVEETSKSSRIFNAELIYIKTYTTESRVDIRDKF